ncbi:pectin methylesterase, putative [Talaromyces stipitatus ATCC 10500]|uniref:pectinesterase n=1 Tax=Talaromyces stipitatus (strain ATCC 10500 / CBS 375.48 / QM 6759 / NRRL 1006) TaxID=441959 RepID=B8MA92_TALSN|nr:pectin methylesterase, putative [Talaromyces stipitatus ATCC 10500]EED18594.1 pectin methylesterase, putative [Talaromyces stipitatus ATCC 10500]
MKFLTKNNLWKTLVSISILIPTALSAPASRIDSRLPCQAGIISACPANTIIVSNDHSSPSSQHAHFTSIQSAILSLPHDNSSATILIRAGNYTEQLNITRPGPVTLLGETWDPLTATENQVTVYWSAANSNSRYMDNAFTSILTVAPTQNASLTGAGPTGWPVPADTPYGNSDFRAYNIDFRNVFSEYSAGPSLAVSVSYANAGFYYSGFYSYQDTVYIGKLGNAYFFNSIIAGQTDFLYGFGTAWLQACSLQLRSCGGGITAWKGTNTTYPNKFGVYIVDSTINAANASIAASIKGKCALGRPWNSLHRSIFARTYEDESIESSGYTHWVNGGAENYKLGVTLQAEFETYGPGWNETGRLSGGWDTILNRSIWEEYGEPAKVFQFGYESGGFGYVDWIDWTPWF